MYILLKIMSMVLLVIMVLLSVAFLTLLERKVLGYIQIRKGPNKVGLMGILQPFSDALKLFSKEFIYLNNSNYFIYFFCPMLSLLLSLIIWVLIPNLFLNLIFYLSMMFFMCCLSMGVYTVMFAGWSSNSLYALLGGLRSVAQTISYEVSLILLMMSLMFLIQSYDFKMFLIFQKIIWFFFLLFPLSVIFFISSLAETNRTPFDFAEGESELVSGFNIEYSSGGFALIFMAEYSSILFMSFIFSLMFLGADFYSFVFYIKVMVMSFIFIWVRGTLPRFRYDKLMYMAWKGFLPISLNFILWVMGFMLMLL
nr:NADH dehydrogenase subunit 1 [Aviostivalius klossi bispiniformis]